METFNDFIDIRHFRADAILRTTRVRGYSTPDWVDSREWLPSTTTLFVNGAGLRRIDNRLQPVATPWDIGAMPLDLGPEKLVVSALDEPTVRESEDVMFHGAAHHAVSFTHHGARPYETFWAPWGDITTRLTRPNSGSVQRCSISKGEQQQS